MAIVPPSPSDLRLLGVFAHPDDEVFCAGGTLAKYIEQGATAMVASFTQGEAGQIRDAAVATRRSLGAKRSAELHRACAELGVQYSHCFDYGDGKLQSVPLDTLIAPIVGLIRDFRPHVVFTFDETGAYGHPDHIAICHATTRAVQHAADPTYHGGGSGAAYAVDRLYHAVFPQSGRLLLNLIVRWLQSLDTRYRGSEEFIHALMLFADESTMLGYASDHIEVDWYPSGFYIIEQGEPAVSLYLVLSGKVNIYVEDSNGAVRYIESHGPGTFVGETGLAYGQPRNAHVIAAENTTCLVFSPGEPTNFAGRGETGQFATADSAENVMDTSQTPVTTAIDVRGYVQQKIRALSEHRTQYPIKPGMFPVNMLEELMGTEYFRHVRPKNQLEATLLPDA